MSTAYVLWPCQTPGCEDTILTMHCMVDEHHVVYLYTVQELPEMYLANVGVQAVTCRTCQAPFVISRDLADQLRAA